MTHEQAPQAFVGRERELAELKAAVAAAATGRGTAFLVSGEPGIGKTCLANAAVTEAERQGFAPLWGRCWESGGAPAYWPWIQVLRAIAEREPQLLAEQQVTGVSEIIQLLPELRDMLGGDRRVLAAEHTGEYLPRAADPEYARFALFDAVTQLVKRAARSQPRVMVIDDVHAADPPSVRLLHFMARELRGTPLLLIVTARDTEDPVLSQLTRLLGDLARDCRSLTLRGLQPAEITQFVEQAVGRTPSPALGRALWRVTGGNAFFVNELVGVLTAEGRFDDPDAVLLRDFPVPVHVREAVRCHLRPLTPAAKHWLSAASVIGSDFDVRVLHRLQQSLAKAESQVPDADNDGVVEALDAAVRAHIIAESETARGCYQFVHALIRDTLYDDLPPAERVRLHSAVGRALETLSLTDPACPLDAIAYHCFEAAAVEPQRAIAYAQRAAVRALAETAYEDAAEHYRRALDVLGTDERSHTPGTPEHSLVCELLLGTAEAQMRAGNIGAARETSAHAAELARASSDRQLAHMPSQECVLPDDAIGATSRALHEADVDMTMVRKALKPAPLVTPESVAVPFRQPPDVTDVFRREGEYWTLAYASCTVRLKHSQGLAYLGHLLRYPNVEFHALDLAGITGVSVDTSEVRSTRAATGELSVRACSAGAGEHLDADARTAYQQRLCELGEELEQARLLNDLGRTEQLQREIGFLQAELSRAYGFNGRSRHAASDAERARVNVARAIAAAVKRIQAQHSDLGCHLRATIRTGMFCSYSPDPRVPIRWET